MIEMITLTHLAIAVILLITLGAFVVQRSAIDSARSYRRGKEDSLKADAKRQSVGRHAEAVANAERTNSPPTTDELLANVRSQILQANEQADLPEHLANLALSLPSMYEPLKPTAPPRPERTPRRLQTEFPPTKD